MLMKLFRQVSVLEGVTTLLLFLLAMPLKYGFGWDALIRPLGMLHGAAFTLYIALLVPAFAVNRIAPMGWLRSVIAAFVPFGTFLNHDWLRRQSPDLAQAAPARQDRLLLIALLSLGAAAVISAAGPARSPHAEARAVENPATVILAALSRTPAQQVALPWQPDQAVWLGNSADRPAAARTLYEDAGRSLALVAADAAMRDTGAAYDRRFLISLAGLYLLQQGETTGEGWGPERLLAEARLSAGGSPEREAALSLLIELP